MIFTYTFRRSFILTDRAAILIGPLATGYFWLRGGPMPEGLDGLIAVGVIITAGGALLARLVSAPYVIWRRDQSKIQRLQGVVDHPHQRERETAAEHVGKLRAELSDSLARMLALIEVFILKPEERRSLDDGLAANYTAALRRTRELINALSYDVPLRIAAHNLASLAAKIGAEAVEGADVSKDMDRLQSMKKITFRLLHKKDASPAAEMISMLEIQNLASDEPEGEMPSTPPENADFDTIAAWLKARLRDPEMAHALRRKIEAGDADSL